MHPPKKEKKKGGVEQSGYISTVNGDPERLETADLDFQKKKKGAELRRYFVPFRTQTQ